MPDDLAQQVAEAVARARTSPTVDVADFATLAGKSRNRVYSDLRNADEICGIKVLRLGKSIRIPSRPLLALLYLDQDPPAGA